MLLDGWTDYRNQNRLPGDRTTTQLQLLKPAQAYHVRLYSENDIGISAPSDVLFIVTDSEVPSAPPTNVMVDSLGPQQVNINNGYCNGGLPHNKVMFSNVVKAPDNWRER